MQRLELSLKQIKEIKSLRNKIIKKKHKQNYVWGKTKRFFTKWKNNMLFQPFVVAKHFKIGQLKIRFPQRKLARRAFVLKETLRLNFLLSPYNLVVNIKGQEAYLQVKEVLEFSQLGLLNFEFWHLSKTWVKSLFSQNFKKVNLQKFLNGSVLVIKTQTINELFDTLELFSNCLEKVTPVGIFFAQRFFWISHGLDLFSTFIETIEELQAKILKKTSNFVFLFSCLFKFLNFKLYQTLHSVLGFQPGNDNKQI